MKRADADAGRAWQLLVRFFFAQRGRLPSTAELDLSPVQCHVLHLIEPGQPLPMSRLAETLSCDASNVTGLVDRLESRGLVQRCPSPGDRRVKVLALTPAGSRLRGQLLKRMTGRHLPLSRLSADDQRTLVRILERLVDDRWP
ncbi:MAG: MarR family transcriptional regulator [Acidobacteria bacterium]|nr:MAG: MarR family transcriptional regulator [Acidobacteriota bacterium]